MKQQVSLQRIDTIDSGTTSSSSSSSSSYNFYSSDKIIPSNYYHQRSTTPPPIPKGNDTTFTEKLFVRRNSSTTGSSTSRVKLSKVQIKLTSLLRSIFFKFPNIIIPTCKWLSIPAHPNFSLTPTLGRKVTGTLFGYRRGHVSFAVQEDPRSEPAFLLELAVSTSALVKEMSSGLVRIALECEKGDGGGAHMMRKLYNEPMWTMYCNGRSCGYSVSRTCTELDLHVLSTVRTVSVGAGVIPIPMVEGGKGSTASCDHEGGELLYMRARFERVVGSRDSEAFYMMNPDGNGGPELSIFLLRL